MANRYWVGGSGNWSDDTNHWASTSGGSPSTGNLPTSLDNVIINSSSGLSGGTITLDSINGEMNNFTSSTGISYTIDDLGDGVILSIYGSILLESGLTYNGYGINFNASSETNTITTAGVNIKETNIIGNGTFNLQDDLFTSANLTIETDSGTFNANNHNLICYAIRFYLGNILMGNGTWQCSQFVVENGNITQGSSTIKLMNGLLSEENNSYFYSSGKVFNNIWLYGVGDSIIQGSSTFNDFKIDAGTSVTFNETTTQTVTSLTATGTSGNLITINSINGDGNETGRIVAWEVNSLGSGYSVDDGLIITTGDGNGEFSIYEVDGSGVPTSYDLDYGGTGYSVANNVATTGGTGVGLTINITEIYVLGQHTLSKSSDTVSCDYLDISNSNTTGGATWYAGSHSVDTTNNDGWLFTDAPSGNNTTNFFQFF